MLMKLTQGGVRLGDVNAIRVLESCTTKDNDGSYVTEYLLTEMIIFTCFNHK